MSQKQVEQALDRIEVGTSADIDTELRKNGIILDISQIREELYKLYSKDIIDRIPVLKEVRRHGSAPYLYYKI